MSDQFWHRQTQLERIESQFELSLGLPRVNDRSVIGGIAHFIGNGLRWRGAPAIHAPFKTLYDRVIRCSRMGVFDRMFAPLTPKTGRRIR